MNILVADDNVLVRVSVADNLEDRGHSVVQAKDGLEALAAVRSQTFDAVLLDLMMPRMTGMDAAREIRRDPTFLHLPIFAFSGMYDLEGFDRSLFTRVMLKPMPLDAVAEVIEKEISKAAIPRPSSR